MQYKHARVAGEQVREEAVALADEWIRPITRKREQQRIQERPVSHCCYPRQEVESPGVKNTAYMM